MSQQYPTTPPPQPQGGMPIYNGAPEHTTYSPDAMRGEKAAQTSLIFGIIGLFFAGIVFGPLAIWQASKAERMNQSATAGKVLGWLAVVWGIGQVVLVFVAIGAFVAVSSSSGY
ncbi:hypothetical protein SAMN05216184_101352 [Georgenia satyanarayanai]|uniref:DUF4190 domain-containing protein n=1 Tax=Georgenia satyanarayanai TaxID=860221 RepID=A0A2Y8ZWI3_9MICO|nr:hypothetical protein [Georgenia satyanarayanai]PYG01887.1 hypothetical protein A8987_101352 [Georgenia satyanarayanai]SSA36690.1 hypothetical protein SAMN05216184_101352 [Georgenia satyanarayanai]